MKVSSSTVSLKATLRATLSVATLSLAVLSFTGLTGCVATKPNETKHNIVINAQGVPNYYRVKNGDTVGKIAKRYHLNYRYIGRLNKLDSKYRIYTGQWLKLWEGRGSVQATINNKPSYPQPVNPTITGSSQYGYIYPTNNAMIRGFGVNGSNGMWFAGKKNDPVHASQSGTVIYAGNGLAEYGNLLIIRHSDELVTAYAHNNKLLVREGTYVSRGQRIATMGSTGNTNQVALEFQVRRNGTAVNPRLFIR